MCEEDVVCVDEEHGYEHAYVLVGNQWIMMEMERFWKETIVEVIFILSKIFVLIFKN